MDSEDHMLSQKLLVNVGIDPIRRQKLVIGNLNPQDLPPFC